MREQGSNGLQMAYQFEIVWTGAEELLVGLLLFLLVDGQVSQRGGKCLSRGFCSKETLEKAGHPELTTYHDQQTSL